MVIIGDVGFMVTRFSRGKLPGGMDGAQRSVFSWPKTGFYTKKGVEKIVS